MGATSPGLRSNALGAIGGADEAASDVGGLVRLPPGARESCLRRLSAQESLTNRPSLAASLGTPGRMCEAGRSSETPVTRWSSVLSSSATRRSLPKRLRRLPAAANSPRRLAPARQDHERT